MIDLRVEGLNRREKVFIRVNKREVAAYMGETVLAALTAVGIRQLRSSRKDGEPRGALCAMGVCHECLVTINGVTNQRACLTEIADNMEIEIDEH